MLSCIAPFSRALPRYTRQICQLAKAGQRLSQHAQDYLQLAPIDRAKKCASLVSRLDFSKLEALLQIEESPCALATIAQASALFDREDLFQLALEKGADLKPCLFEDRLILSRDTRDSLKTLGMLNDGSEAVWITSATEVMLCKPRLTYALPTTFNFAGYKDLIANYFEDFIKLQPLHIQSQLRQALIDFRTQYTYLINASNPHETEISESSAKKLLADYASGNIVISAGGICDHYCGIMIAKQRLLVLESYASHNDRPGFTSGVCEFDFERHDLPNIIDNYWNSLLSGSSHSPTTRQLAPEEQRITNGLSIDPILNGSGCAFNNVLANLITISFLHLGEEGSKIYSEFYKFLKTNLAQLFYENRQLILECFPKHRMAQPEKYFESSYEKTLAGCCKILEQ
jgi:hypothetical protein